MRIGPDGIGPATSEDNAMSTKQMVFDDSALLEMKRGVDQLADAVKCTMGPSGRHVVIE